MSSLRVHTIQSIAASAALYPVIGEHAIPFGLAAIFIDVDHVIEYVRDTGSLDIRGVFSYCNLIENNLDKGFLVLNIFHTAEFFALLVFLALLYPVLVYVLAGWAFHLCADLFHLIVTLRKPFARVYSILEYVYRSRNGKNITSIRELLQKDNLRTEKVHNLRGWLRKWGVMCPAEAGLNQ